MSKFIQKVSRVAEKQLLIEMKKQAFWQLGEQRESLFNADDGFRYVP